MTIPSLTITCRSEPPTIVLGALVTNNIIKNNLFVSKVASQYAASYNSVANDLNLLGALDTNCYACPINDNLTFLTYQPSTGSQVRSLAGWQAFSGQDANSYKSPLAITNVNDLRFEYNATTVATNVTLDVPYLDMRGSNYSGSLTLQPFTSVVLIKNLAALTNNTVAFSAAAYSVAESGALATITVTRTSGGTGAASVNYATSDGTATAGLDYAAVSGTLTWAAGDFTSKTFAIPIINDSLSEANETVNLTLGSPTNALVGIQGTAVLTIMDDDQAASFTAAAQSTSENDGTATITVQLSAASSQPVSLPFAVTGTAANPADYAITASPLIIPAGVTNANLTVTLVSDAIIEGSETVIVTLGTPTNAVLGAPRVHTLTIIDGAVPPAPTGLTEMVNFSATNITLGWRSCLGATNYNIKRANVSGGAYTLIGTAPANGYTDATVVNGTSYYYVVSAVNARGESGNSAEPAVLWTNMDVGTVGVIGSGAISAAGVYSTAGSGNDIGVGESFNYTCQPLTGDGTLLARLTYANPGEGYPLPKVGIMMRETLGASAKNACVMHDFSTPFFCARMSSRSTDGGTTSWVTGTITNVPVWFKLVRSGTTFTGYVSTDGTNWTMLGSTTISLAGTIYAGLLDCSRNTSQLFPVTFDNVIVGTVPAATVTTIASSGNPIANGFPVTFTATASPAPLNGEAITFKDGGNVLGTSAIMAGQAMFSTSALAAGLHSVTAVYGGDPLYSSSTSPAMTQKVVAVGPVQMAVQLVGGQLQYSWPADHIGWRLQMQTNAPNTGLGTNWQDIPNSTLSNQVMIPIDPNNNAFFRLVYP